VRGLSAQERFALETAADDSFVFDLDGVEAVSLLADFDRLHERSLVRVSPDGEDIEFSVTDLGRLALRVCE